MNSHLLDSLWQNRWAGAAVACGLAALAGRLVAWIMPRGPATAPQALIIMALGLATGLTAGLLMRTRWALLLAPLAYVVASELARRGWATCPVNRPGRSARSVGRRRPSPEWR